MPAPFLSDVKIFVAETKNKGRKEIRKKEKSHMKRNKNR
jgi:hypothetical protein